MKLVAHQVRALKDKRPLVQISVNSADQAAAAEAAGGIDIIVNGERARWSEVRRAAPQTHPCLSMVHGEAASHADALRQGFAA